MNSDKQRLIMQRMLMDEVSTVRKLFQLPPLRLREQYKGGSRENVKSVRQFKLLVSYRVPLDKSQTLWILLGLPSVVNLLESSIS